MVDNKNAPQELAYTRGVPASGKSTFSMEWEKADLENRLRVNRDDIRQELFGKDIVLDKTGRPDKHAEGKVTNREDQLIRNGLKAGKDVMVDATHLGGTNLFKRMEHFRAERARVNPNIVVKNYDFPISLEEAIKRNAARSRVVPEKVIRSMYAGLGPNGEFLHVDGTYPIKPFVAPDGRKLAIAFDMDGTLTDVRDIRHYVERKPGDKRHRNFDLFHRKSLYMPANEAVLALAMQAHENGYAVIITTARQERYREVTQKWLDEHNVPFENMFMRADNDSRPDYVVKHDMLNDKILPHYDVIRCVDDNPQAVQAWRYNNIEVTTVPFIDYNNAAQYHGKALPVEDVFKSGKCLRCGKPISKGLIGPRCALVS